jgi:hypothetical protein
VAEIVAATVPSGLGLDGILAPDPARHALLIVAHAWAHEPLRCLRDLVDVQAVAAFVDRGEIQRVSSSWRVTRLWRTVDTVASALLGQSRTPLAFQLFGRHLIEVRERTVLENHLQQWL